MKVDRATHSDCGVHISYQLCCFTRRKDRTWKKRQVRIWVRTEKSSGPDMRLDGGRRHTSSFHAGFRLTGHRDTGRSESVTAEGSHRQYLNTCLNLEFGEDCLFYKYLWYSLVKAMMRMMAMSMKRNWKSPKLLRIWKISQWFSDYTHT